MSAVDIGLFRGQRPPSRRPDPSGAQWRPADCCSPMLTPRNITGGKVEGGEWKPYKHCAYLTVGRHCCGRLAMGKARRQWQEVWSGDAGGPPCRAHLSDPTAPSAHPGRQGPGAGARWVAGGLVRRADVFHNLSTTLAPRLGQTWGGMGHLDTPIQPWSAGNAPTRQPPRPRGPRRRSARRA